MLLLKIQVKSEILEYNNRQYFVFAIVYKSTVVMIYIVYAYCRTVAKKKQTQILFILFQLLFSSLSTGVWMIVMNVHLYLSLKLYQIRIVIEVIWKQKSVLPSDFEHYVFLLTVLISLR